MTGLSAAEQEASWSHKPTRRTLKLMVFGALILLGITGFVSLGTWQLERRVWKLTLIDRITHRIHAQPVAAPAPSEWPRINAADYEYRHVKLIGRFQNNQEVFVQAVTQLGPGYWVLTPFCTANGFTVLVNRGFVPAERRDAATRAAGLIDGDHEVTGLIRMTEPQGGFLRHNDFKSDRWYSRDVQAIAAVHRLSAIAPYFVDIDDTPVPGGLPVGGLTVVNLPNNHLLYALTWFGLAAMLTTALAYIGFDARRHRIEFALRQRAVVHK